MPRLVFVTGSGLASRTRRGRRRGYWFRFPVSAPVTTYADDFNRADGPLAGTGPGTWVWSTAVNPGLSIVSNKAATATSGGTVVSVTPDLSSSDMEVSAVCIRGSAPTTVGVVARAQDGNNYYAFRANTSNVLGLVKVVVGTITTILDNLGTFSAGTRIGIRCQGSTITGYVNGSSVGSVTDTSIATGTKAGLRGAGGDPRATFDDFTAATV